jgi:hypothetical protein
MEMALITVVFAIAFSLPRLGASLFYKSEGFFKKLARGRALSVATVGLAAFLLRIAILPLFPIPHPFTPNDFSFLLAANTFASGRLTNPTPAMWTHFETIHVTMNPTYMSMYFPASGLVMAAGKVLTGQPWYGLLLSTALMCAAICWMLQAWLPPAWALLGGLLSILRLGLFSYWINTYSGGGAVAALGGALVLGALPRWTRHARGRDAVFLSIGVAILLTARPYEGAFLCVPVSIMLIRWFFTSPNRPSTPILLRRTALPFALICFACIGNAYYNYRAFGSPLTLPYTVDRATYATTPYFVWQQPHPEPIYRNVVMRNFYHNNELAEYNVIHSVAGFILGTIFKIIKIVLFFSGIALLPGIIMMRRAFMDRRIRFLVLCVGIAMVGMAIQVFLLPHYLAPFTAAFYAIELQAMRHLRLWEPGRQPVGKALSRLLVAACVVLAAMRLDARQLHLELLEWPSSEWIGQWYGPGPFGGARADIETAMERLPGGQLMIVRYSAAHKDLNEWVYNEPDIDNSKVIWARELQPASDLDLIHYYKDRKVWLVQPDSDPVTVSPYIMPKDH